MMQNSLSKQSKVRLNCINVVIFLLISGLIYFIYECHLWIGRPVNVVFSLSFSPNGNLLAIDQRFETKVWNSFPL